MGKTVFITGASSGIGEALATELAARGYDLALAARRTQNLDSVREEIAARHPDRRIETRTLDVTDYAAVETVVADVAQALGGLDIVVANAGRGSTGPVGAGNFEGDRAVIETNVIGA